MNKLNVELDIKENVRDTLLSGPRVVDGKSNLIFQE